MQTENCGVDGVSRVSSSPGRRIISVVKLEAKRSFRMWIREAEDHVRGFLKYILSEDFIHKNHFLLLPFHQIFC